LTQLYIRVLVGPSTSRTQMVQEQLASIVMLPYPRFNAILLAAPKARIEEIKKQIKEFDVPNKPDAEAKPFYLQKQPASRVAQTINNFYAQRYAGQEISFLNQIRITWDDTSNAIFVQAAPADMAEIAKLIETLDTSESKSVNDLRIIPLRNGLAD